MMNRRPTQTKEDILFGRLGRTKQNVPLANECLVFMIMTRLSVDDSEKAQRAWRSIAPLKSAELCFSVRPRVSAVKYAL
jgi:hypothetical protein